MRWYLLLKIPQQISGLFNNNVEVKKPITFVTGFFNLVMNRN
jgi:hypothetical protein